MELAARLHVASVEVLDAVVVPVEAAVAAVMPSLGPVAAAVTTLPLASCRHSIAC